MIWYTCNECGESFEEERCIAAICPECGSINTYEDPLLNDDDDEWDDDDLEDDWDEE